MKCSSVVIEDECMKNEIAWIAQQQERGGVKLRPAWQGTQLAERMVSMAR